MVWNRHKKLLLFFLIVIIARYSIIPVFSQTEEEASLYKRGNAHCMKAEWNPAIRTFKRLLEVYPDTVYQDTRFWIGHSHLELGQYNEGIRWLEIFVNLYPNNSYTAEALYKIGEAYEYGLKDYNKALEFYDRVVDKFPRKVQSVHAAQNKADIYAQRSLNYPKAVIKLEESKEIAVSQGISPQSPYIVKANQRISFIRENSDYNYAPLMMYTRGLNFEEVKRWNLAIAEYREVLKKFPGANIADDSHYRIIECYLELGKNDQVKSEAETFLKNYPKSKFAGKVRNLLK
jgi:TolA-binding protein